MSVHIYHTHVTLTRDLYTDWMINHLCFSAMQTWNYFKIIYLF